MHIEGAQDMYEGGVDDKDHTTKVDIPSSGVMVRIYTCMSYT